MALIRTYEFPRHKCAKKRPNTTAQGGKGKANDIFGSVYGWLISKEAPKETLGFVKVLLGKDIQIKLAAEGLSIPMVKGTVEAIQNLFYKALALEVNHSGWIGLAMDQLLGRETGRVFNDEALAVAAGIRSPEQAAQTIENFGPKIGCQERPAPVVWASRLPVDDSGPAADACVSWASYAK